MGASEDAGLTPAAHADQPARIGRHRIVRLLGEGSMGQVYEAIAEDDGARVALKVIRDPTSVRSLRLKREFRALARVSHPGLVTLYELEEELGVLFFTMEPLDGADVVAALCGQAEGERTGAPDLTRLTAVLLDVAHALVAIHSAGLVHRDIKPSNIFVTNDGRVVLLDLGLARDIDGVHLEAAAEGRRVAGTPLYMAPEQISQPHAVGPAADWFAVGEVIVELLTGAPRLSSHGFRELVAAKLGDTPLPALEPGFLAGQPDREKAQFLWELASALLVRSAEDRPSGAEVLTRLGSSANETWTSESPPLLGREEEVQVLESALAAALAGAPQVCLIDGPSGIGKSALLHHFLSETRWAHGAIALSARSSERESIPHKAVDAIIDALAVIVTESRALASRLEARDVEAAGRLFPALRAALLGGEARLESTHDPVEGRRLGFAAIGDLFQAVRATAPVILGLDDLQWADVDSMQLIEALLRRVPRLPLLIVGTLRSGAREYSEAVRRLEAAVSDTPGVGFHRITVAPLAETVTRSLATAVLGRANGAAIERVVREASGSPFYALELARFVRRVGDALPVGALDAIIAERLLGLSVSDRRLLRAVALSGGRLRRRVAVRASRLGEDSRRALTRLRVEALLRTSGSGPDIALETCHDRIREAAVRDTPANERTALHQAIAAEMSSDEHADPTELAYHYRASGQFELACTATLAAIANAERSLAFEQASRLIAQLLEPDACPGLERATLLARQGASLANAGRLRESGAAYLSACEEIDEEDPRRSEWLRLAAEHLLISGHVTEGRAALAEMLRKFGLRLHANFGRAVVSLLAQRAALGLRGLRYTVRAAADIPEDIAHRADACWTASRGLIYSDGITATDFHARHLRLALGSGDPVRIARALAAEAQLRAFMGTRAWPSARAMLEEADALATAHKSPYARAMTAQFRAGALISAALFSESIAEYRRAVEIFRNECGGVTQEVGYCEAHASSVLLLTGQVRALRQIAVRLLHEGMERQNPYVEGFARGHLGNMALLALGDVAGAEEHLRLYRQAAPRLFQSHQLNCAAQTAALERYRGDPVSAHRLMEAEWPAISRLVTFRAAMPRAELLFWRGQCSVAAGALTGSPRGLLDVALKMAKELRGLDYPVAPAYGALLEASVRGIQGREDLAAASLRGAITRFEELGVSAFLATARRRLGDLIGGTDGQTARALSDGWMADEGVLYPDAFTEMMAPGFAARHAGS